MSNEISRVYQFLAERPDWKTEMDTNNDGTILKSEFRDFLTAEFDWSSLEGWNGETSKQTDLINDFWKSIDTTQTGNITGTNFKNKNALDSKEITNMNLKIEMYEILNEYTSTLSIPSVVSDSSRWKQSVSQSLANLTETFIKNGGVKEDLLAYLESVSEGVQNKTTADCVADEYLNSELKDFMKEYNYSYLEDTTLQGIINNYIQNIPEESTAEDIKSTVQLIVDAYLATAGIKEDNAFDLGAYGYTVNDATTLNDLQKTYLTKTLQTTFESVQNESNYEANKELYDNAVNEFINSILSNAKFNDFETIKGYTYEMFTNSEQYKEVTDVVTAKELLQSDELYNKVASEINQSLADLIKKDGRYLKVMDDIEAQMITKVKSGEFSVNGNLDTNAALEWAVGQIKSRIMEFYENGLGNLSISELNNVYDQLEAAAKQEVDDDKSLNAYRDAAIKYCDAIAKKSNELKEAVVKLFGDSWATSIKKMYPSEITELMTELKANALKIGEIENYTVSDISGIENNIALDNGTTNNYYLSANVKNGSYDVDASKISYQCTGDIAQFNAPNNLVITAPSAAGIYKVTIQTLYDGQPIGEPKTVQVTVKPSTEKIIGDVKDWGGLKTEHIESWSVNKNKQIIETSFTDLYNQDATIRLHVKMDKKGADWSNQKEVVQERITQVGDLVVAALATSGLDKSKLQTAASTVINRYMTQGIAKTENDKGTNSTDITNNAHNYMTENRELTRDQIVQCKDTDGKDSVAFMIHFKDFVDSVLEEYWKLV